MVKECIISEISTISRAPGDQDVNPSAQEVTVIQTTGATFQVNNAKLYVLVVALSINQGPF